MGRHGDPDTPGWTARVVPNLYPAFEHQEVVVHSPRHVRTFAELDDGEVSALAAAWRHRAAAARAAGFGYVHALVNEGRPAGASLAHSHSQLVWLRDTPPERAVEAAGSPLRDVLADELAAGGRIVLEGDGALLLCPAAGRGPYELLVAPRENAGADAFASPLLGETLRLLREAVARLRRLEGPVSWNAWLHDGEGWHLHVLPRLAVHAGVELGAGIYVNALPPEDAAAALRGAG